MGRGCGGVPRAPGFGRAAISFAASVGLLLYGLSGPVAGWLMDRFGPTRITLVGLALIGGSTLAGAAMTEPWQLNLFWGVLSGVGTGIVAPVLGATVANRWFAERRGLVLGSSELPPPPVSSSRCPR